MISAIFDERLYSLLFYLVWLMDDDVEGDDPDDGDEIVEELMDGTNTRSWDDFDISWEVVASPIKYHWMLDFLKFIIWDQKLG